MRSSENNKVSEKEWAKLVFEWTTMLRRINIQLRYYLKINPYELDRNTWARRFEELQWIRQEEAKQFQTKQ